VDGLPRPEVDWKLEADGSVRVESKTPPSEVLLWQATNEKARDFRLDSIGKAYKSSPLTSQGGGGFVASVPKPAAGWTAFFVELSYPVGKHVMKITTGTRIIPETLPSDPPPRKKR